MHALRARERRRHVLVAFLDLLLPDLDRVRWDELQVFPWVQKLEGCPQDPVHHAEGNVWIHTRMVLETLLAMPAFRALPPADRDIVHVACLMHDVAKPATTRLEDGASPPRATRAPES